jgi:hypothetical protein
LQYLSQLLFFLFSQGLLPRVFLFLHPGSGCKDTIPFPNFPNVLEKEFSRFWLPVPPF